MHFNNSIQTPLTNIKIYYIYLGYRCTEIAYRGVLIMIVFHNYLL